MVDVNGKKEGEEEGDEVRECENWLRMAQNFEKNNLPHKKIQGIAAAIPWW